MPQRFRVSQNGRPVALASAGADDSVLVDGQRFHVVGTSDGRYVVTAENGETSIVAVAGTTLALWVSARGRALRLGLEIGPERTLTARAVTGALTAPMPATVAKILVVPGERVQVGATLVVLEAMKMELPIRAPRDGVVRAVACRVGQLVAPGPPLVEMES